MDVTWYSFRGCVKAHYPIWFIGKYHKVRNLTLNPIRTHKKMSNSAK